MPFFPHQTLLTLLQLIFSPLFNITYLLTIHPDKVKTHYFGVNEFLERFNDESIEAKPEKKLEKPKEKKAYHQSKEEKAAVKKCENRIKKAEREIESYETEIALKSNEIDEIAYNESE